MKEDDIERFLTALEYLAQGVNKIGDGVNSISNYLWLPIYLLLFLVFVVSLGYLIVSFL